LKITDYFESLNVKEFLWNIGTDLVHPFLKLINKQKYDSKVTHVWRGKNGVLNN
jgi:hypothetical protein